MIFCLYVKTHKNGLKYLGQTNRNPYDYLGSGTYWRRYLKQYGNDITTEIIGAFDTLDDLKVAGQFWSNHWNIVKSKEWANLKEEVGDGGSTKGRILSETTKTKMSLNRIGKKISQETKIKIALALTGKSFTEERIHNVSIGHKGQIPWIKGKKHSEESKQKMSKARLGIIPWNKGKKFI